MTLKTLLDKAAGLDKLAQRELASAILYWMSYEPDEAMAWDDVPLELGCRQVIALMREIDADGMFDERMALQAAATIASWQVEV